MASKSWRVFYTTVIVYTIPTLAYFIDPILTSAEIEARLALVTPTPTGPRQHRRQETAEETEPATRYIVTYAPNSTCGYLSGSVQIPITCENQGICLWELEFFRYIACSISGKTTGLAHTKCLQQDEALDSVLCDDVCASNTYNLFCTNETEPYCRTYAYPKGVRDYICASTPATRVSSVDFTYDGQKQDVFNTSTFSPVDGTTREITGSLTTTATDSAGTAPATAEPTKDHKRRSVVGPAVGGSIGGVLGLCLIGFLIYWYRRRQKQKKSKNASSAGSNPEDTLEQVPPRTPDRQAVDHRSSTASPGISHTRTSPPSPPPPPPPPDTSEEIHELGDYRQQRLAPQDIH
ncbi:Fc.00g032740.m01.CDS01 [Cosmosporella sp. VM-42]